MAVHLSNLYIDTYSDFSTSGETYVLGAPGRIIATGENAVEMTGTDNVTFRVFGGISGSGTSNAGIAEDGTGSRIEIGETGMVQGYWALELRGDVVDAVNAGYLQGDNAAVIVNTDNGGTFVNNGEIFSPEGIGIRLEDTHPSFTIRNSGVINATTGISLDGLENHVELGKASILRGTSIGISNESPDGSVTTVNNHGLLRSLLSHAYSGVNDATDILTNSGRIFGIVSLGGGSDRFVMVGGSVDSGVFGGEGDDTYIIKKGSVDFLESAGQGADTIKTAVSYNLHYLSEVETLILTGAKNINVAGSTTNNDIQGNAGNNRLSGDADNDMLTGGGGRDTFVFSANFDTDTITDFKHGQDRIDLRNFTDIHNVGDLLLSKVGDNVLINPGTSDLLIIENARIKDFDNGDFLFAA